MVTSTSESALRIECGPAVLRPFAPGDEESLVPMANDRDVWINLRDRFPHPYTREHAVAYIADAAAQQPARSFAICVDDRAVGGISILMQPDIARVSGEIGYWLGKPYWGRGIMTPVVRALTRYAIDTFAFTRVFAVIGTHNDGSRRVLEKAGFVREGHLLRSYIKDGVVGDEYVYGFHA
jgi:[ribosomal protein S5]-alanine N-acetyltransferase